MYCQYCGKKITDNSSFCQYCGESLIPAEGAAMDGEKIKVANKSNKKIFAILVAIVAILVIGFTVIQFALLGVKKISNNCEFGETVQIKDLLQARSSNAQIIFDDEVSTNEIGDCTISYTIKNGFFSAHRTVKISVVDTTAPKIKGPSVLVIGKGENIELSDLYLVEDKEKNLEYKLSLKPKISISEEGISDTSIIVSDTSGNVGSLNIKVNVVELTESEKLVKKAIYQYQKDKGVKISDITTAVLYKTSGAANGISYYILFGTDIIYGINTEGDIKEYTRSDAGDSPMYELLVYAILKDGESINLHKFR